MLMSEPKKSLIFVGAKYASTSAVLVNRATAAMITAQSRIALPLLCFLITHLLRWILEHPLLGLERHRNNVMDPDPLAVLHVVQKLAPEALDQFLPVH